LSSRKEKIKWYEGEISDQADRDQKQSDFIVQWSVTHSEQFEVYEKTHTENIKTGTRNGTVASRTEIDSGAIVLTIIVAKKKDNWQFKHCRKQKTAVHQECPEHLTILNNPTV